MGKRPQGFGASTRTASAWVLPLGLVTASRPGSVSVIVDANDEFAAHMPPDWPSMGGPRVNALGGTLSASNTCRSPEHTKSGLCVVSVCIML